MKKKFFDLLLKIIGWKTTGDYPRHIKKKILAAAPHTSNWDFPLGVMVRGTLNDDVKYIGKASLFKPPIGWIMKALGGVPVDRSKSNNFVQGVVDLFQGRNELSILFAPEGTRKKVEKFKTGFYHIARLANIPILPVVLDYDKKEFRFEPLYYPTSNIEADIENIEKIFKGVKGYNKKRSF